MNRRRALLSLIEYKQTEPSIPTNEIWYTSSGGNVVTPYATTVFGANIVSNTYVNGQGIISFDGPVTTIGDRAFFYCSLTSVTIPRRVTEIGSQAFSNCKRLTSVIIGGNATTIGNYAFSSCDRLTSVTIPDSVTTIGFKAFNKCISITSITIPDSVTLIGNQAFEKCAILTSVYCKAMTPPRLSGTYVFKDNATSRRIYVPINSVSTYTSATNWSEYADAIVGYDFVDDVEE